MIIFKNAFPQIKPYLGAELKLLKQHQPVFGSF